jgi:hypothetical protein
MMKEPTGLPERRPMPEGLRDRLWADIEPQLEKRGSGNRFLGTMRAPLAVAASVIVLAAALAIAIPQLRSHDEVPAAGNPADAVLVDECVKVSATPLPVGSWRAGARIDVDSEKGFLVIRDDEYAAVCLLKNGRAQGVWQTATDGDVRHTYSKLTAARPFDYLVSDNEGSPVTESVHFGIATSDVTGVSLIGPDNSVTPAVVRDGTFAVRSRYAESTGVSSTNRIRATLENGQVIEGTLR